MKFFKLGDDRPFVISVVVSLVIMLISITWTLKVGEKSNHYAHILGHLQDGLDDLKKETAKTEARR